jgi:hypothetical protein
LSDYDDVAALGRDETVQETYEFIRAHEDRDDYGVPDDDGVAGTEVIHAVEHEAGDLYRAFCELLDMGLVERQYYEMQETAMAEKDAFDAITEYNERHGEMDPFYSTEPVFRTLN